MSTHYREISRCELRLQLAEKAIANATLQRHTEMVGLGKALRAAREAKGISLRQIATQIGLSAPFISDCELGRRSMSPAKRAAYMKTIRPLLTMTTAETVEAIQEAQKNAHKTVLNLD